MRSERAKIFAPFSPLKGMDKAYREKERVAVQKAELLSDRIEEIDSKLRLIKKGSYVEVTYYEDGTYKRHKGKVYSISPEKNIFTVGLPIYFSDIYDIEIKDDINTK